MKTVKHLLSLSLFCSSVLFAGDREDIIQVVMESNDYQVKNNRSMDIYSKEGALEFWSSGGLMNRIEGAEGRINEFESVSMSIKHIEVLVLVPKKAAVAMYYSEGSMTPKGSKPVNHYMTRVTQVFVKENGEWKVRASHWSPVTGGAGTSQTALN